MKEDFKIHTNFPRYLVYSNGQVFDSVTNELMPVRRYPAGYETVRIMDQFGLIKYPFVHRLVAETFITPTKEQLLEPELEVNHLNGIKTDNRKENLEWCTHIENLLHARKMGLIKTGLVYYSHPVEIRNVDTAEVYQFKSVRECARFLEVSFDAVYWRMKAGTSQIFDGYQYRYQIDNEDKPWPTPVGREVLVRDLKNKEIQIFDTSRDAAKHIGCCEAAIWGWLRKPGQKVYHGFYQVKWLHDKTPWREPTSFEIESNRSRKVIPIEIFSPSTGERRIFASGVECAKAMGLKPSALNMRLQSEKKSVYSDGFMYRYFSPSEAKSSDEFSLIAGNSR